MPNRVAEFDTTHGTFKVELFEEHAPITTKNFIDLIEKEYYDGVIFHRVIPDFMLQGGDPDGTGRGGPGYTITDEFHPELTHGGEGMLSMANSGPDTGGSQFFITLKATPWLDGKHAVFGKVIEGQEIILVVMDYRFMGGSMGSVVGEKITRAIELACESSLPLLVVSASGGARMQEGALSLMQMAKICAALSRFRQRGLPYISVLTDPTTGGVFASFAMLGDINVAEPRALIGFTGQRVIEQTIRQQLPEGFQRSEFLLEHGFLDLVVHRSKLKSTLGTCLRHLS